MKLKCRIGLHEMGWEDRVLRTRYGKAVQRGACRHCGIIRQRFLTLSEHDSESVPEDIETRATGPLPRIKL